ncbi:sugar transferase [Candidatus Peregrinibacteria bacterium]|nr:MAG: sugar transferase [Candidatus Peregrinibacteria bacterium]
MKKSEILFGVIRLPIDFIAIFSSFWVAYHLRPITDLIPGVQYAFGADLLPPIAEYLLFSGVSAIGLILFFAAWNLYSLKVTHRFSQEFFRILFLVSAWLMFIIAYYALIVHQLFFSRITLGHIWIFTIAFVLLGRILIQWLQTYLLRFGIGKRRVLLVGANPVADHLFEILIKNPSYHIIGAVAETMESRKKNQVKLIGELKNIEAIIDKYKIEEIIQTDTGLGEKEVSDLHTYCRNNQIKFHFIPDLIRLQRTNVTVQMVEDIPVVSLRDTSLDGWGHVFKRLFDIVLSLLLIVLLIPIWIIIALAIKLDSKGPVIYKSRRKYRDVVFNVYKFRSMVQNADQMRGKLMEKNERSGPLFKIKCDASDPRGRILKKNQPG